MTTVGTFKSKLEGKLHGTTLARVAGVYAKIGEAAGRVLARVDPYNTKKRYTIENAIYDKVYNYTAPSDLKGTSKIIDIRPIGDRSTHDNIMGRYGREFDIKKDTDTVSVEVLSGVKTLRLSKQLTERTVLHQCDSLTANGTVTGSGDVENLTTDTLNYISGDSSIKFGLSGSTGTGILTFALDSTIDISDLDDVGALFEWLRFPDSTRLTSVTLRWGNDASNYWEETATAAHDRSFVSNAWQLIGHEWGSATEVGTPDADYVDWVQVQVNYTAGTALTGVYLDNITASLGEVWEMIYYSNCLFTDATGNTWKTIPTADTDIVMLDDEHASLLVYEMMLVLAQELQGESMANDYKYFYNELYRTDDKNPGMYEMYAMQNPSEAIIPFETYAGDWSDLDGHGN